MSLRVLNHQALLFSWCDCRMWFSLFHNMPWQFTVLAVPLHSQCYTVKSRGTWDLNGPDECWDSQRSTRTRFCKQDLVFGSWRVDSLFFFLLWGEKGPFLTSLNVDFCRTVFHSCLRVCIMFIEAEISSLFVYLVILDSWKHVFTIICVYVIYSQI